MSNWPRKILVLVAVLSLVVSLAGRTFHYGVRQHNSVRSGLPEAKQQHLDLDSPAQTAPLRTFVPPLQPTVSAHVDAASEPLVQVDFYSCLWNRPPPSC